jgi:hypothetical protein
LSRKTSYLIKIAVLNLKIANPIILEYLREQS